MLTVIDDKIFDGPAGLAPNAMFFLKNASRTYVFSNNAHTEMCGVKSASEVIGRTTCNFFGEHLSARYSTMDQDVLGGHIYQDRFDFLPDAEGHPIWTLFNRRQVQSKNGEALIMGTSKQLPCFRNSTKVYQRLHRATEMISENFKNTISTKALADSNNCSVAQIERDFSNILNITPTLYQARLKIWYIKSQLNAGVSLAFIAYDVGFSEQSTLSRFFKKHTNMTMQEYKRTYCSH